jgi:general secretion pathway protein A
MEPFRLLHLEREPFSNSPDPDFFFEPPRHRDCRVQLELSIRSRRGLNVVVGDVGTGKTTLSRRLLGRLSDDPDMSVHLLLDPGFRSAGEALEAVLACLVSDPGPPGEAARKERLKRALFQRAAEAGKTVVLIIDEGQKIPPFFLEILRELLNFETNQHKLLQIVVFAQPEFETVLRELPNVFDRVSFWRRLTPLSRREAREMIDFRLKAAGASGGAGAFFSPLALLAIHRATRGYPRRIVDLCHHCLLRLILEDEPLVGWRMVRSRARDGRFPRMGDARLRTRRWGLGAGAALGLLFFGLWGFQQMARESGRDPARPRLAVARSTEAAPADTGAEAAAAAPPDLLGAVAMAAGETVGELANRVYGSARPAVIRAVLDANPQIRSPQRIGVGERIGFPTLSPAAAPASPVRVEIERFPTLDSAMSRLRDLRRRNPDLPLRLLSSWRPAAGTEFQLVVDRPFSDAGAAREWLYRLQAESPVPGRVRTEPWPPETIVFGDAGLDASDAGLSAGAP